MLKTNINVQRSKDRFKTNIDWLDSAHSFSFGHHYDSSNTHHGLLLVNNDDVVRPGTGFMTHPHRDMEIVTWVLSGELEHKDSQGNKGIIYPGLAQRMSAGTGIWHSEMNPSSNNDVRLVQMWVVPDTESVDPSYEQMDINKEIAKGGLVPVASGKGHHAAISIRQQGAVLWAGRLHPGQTIRIPDAPYVHVYIALGRAKLEKAGVLGEGDSARLQNAGSLLLTADADKAVEVLVWEMADEMKF